MPLKETPFGTDTDFFGFETRREHSTFSHTATCVLKASSRPWPSICGPVGKGEPPELTARHVQGKLTGLQTKTVSVFAEWPSPPANRENEQMQYFRPESPFFVGDCMPFYHEGTFHVFWLLDEGHHQGLGGLGAHQWAHCSTRDLVHWQDHGLALPRTQEWEASICTGSVFFSDGVYHAFYPTRKRDRTEVLSHAVSDDGITFRKLSPNPFATAPAGFSPGNFRDPFVFTDGTGRFYMLVSSMFEEYPLRDRGGCLLRYSSGDLLNWQMERPFLVPGVTGVPECPDLFEWNGRHYLLFASNLIARYRMSSGPLGPWTRPPVDTFDGAFAAVMKTAPFGTNRRIGVAFLCSRKEDADQGERQWAGNMVFRELLQLDDGTLGTKFVEEMVPPTGGKLDPALEAMTPGARGGNGVVEIGALQGFEAAALRDLPQNYRIRCTASPRPDTAVFGLALRGSGRFDSGYDLLFDWHRRAVCLADQVVPAAVDLRQPCRLDVIVADDIIDVCINNQQCIINRLPGLKGRGLFFFCQNGAVRFDQVDIRPLK